MEFQGLYFFLSKNSYYLWRTPGKESVALLFIQETVRFWLFKDKAQNAFVHLCKYLMLTSFASCCCGFFFLDEPDPLVMWPPSTIIIKRIKIQFELLSLHNAKFNTTEGWFYWFRIGHSMEISYLDTNMVLAVGGTNGPAPALAHSNFTVSSTFHSWGSISVLKHVISRSLWSWNYLQLKQQHKICSLGCKNICMRVKCYKAC